MKKTDKAFWLTVIPAVILWNSFRPWFLELVFGVESASWTAANIIVSCVLAATAGYVAAIVASPQHIRAAANVAIGCTIAFGLQNIIEYRGIGHSVGYFAILPVAVAAAAIMGGALRKVHARRYQES